MIKLKKIISSVGNKKVPHNSLFTESSLKTSFYEELQKNEWCNVISDKPDNLIDIITISIKNTKRI